jgi:hypothetical protein
MARRRREEAAAEAPDWERAAAFVVSFERRRVKDLLELRLVAEQTEPPPEQPVSSWPDWDCGQLCDWLQEGMDRAEATPGVKARPGQDNAQIGQAPTPSSRRVGRAQLSIQHVAIVDAVGRVDAVSDGRPTALAFACTRTGCLEVSVLGATPQQEVRVALRLRGTGGPGWSARNPAAVPREGPAQIEVSDVGIGVHSARLVAWAPDASATPASIELGTLTIRPVE